MSSRVEALSSQINPHFLFNTLASISSLIRSQPETARTLIIKLSGLLRRLLRSQKQFVTLKEELDAIDEYLDIETVRFGPTLVIEKQISPDSLKLIMPSMLLQPLIENAIKHGIGQKIRGGQIIIRSRRETNHAIIEIEDNGSGMDPPELNPIRSDGIGLRNVDERLRVIYGEDYHLKIESVRDEGTCVRIKIPELKTPKPATA